MTCAPRASWRSWAPSSAGGLGVGRRRGGRRRRGRPARPRCRDLRRGRTACGSDAMAWRARSSDGLSAGAASGVGASPVGHRGRPSLGGRARRRGGRGAGVAGPRAAVARLGLGAGVDDRLDPPVVADDVDRGLAHDLGAAAVVEGVAGAGVGEAERERRVVDGHDLGLLGEVDPGHPAALLGGLDDVGPEAAYVDQGQRGAGRGGGRGGRRRAGSGSGRGLGSARARRRLGGGLRRVGVGAGSRPARSARGSAWPHRLGRGLLDDVGGRALDRGGAVGAARGRAGGSPPLIVIRRSRRSRRAITPSVEWSAPGSSTRAQISSSSSRGAVAPRISVRPVATRSAARLSSAGPKRAACATSRSAASSAMSISPVAGRVGHRRDDHEVAEPA